jgi:cytochrome c oxidase subunit 2
MERFLGLPELASAHGGDIDLMIALVHLLMGVLFVGWGAFFVFVVIRFRNQRNATADYEGVRSKSSTYLEIGVAVAEGALLVGLSIPLWAERVDRFPPEDESIVVRVVAEQFAWNVHYPGADGVFGRTAPELIDTASNPLGLDRDDPAAADDITTVNQLHLAVDTPVIIKLTSKDVIHSFSLLEMRVKQDAIPGLDIPLWFVPTVTTEEMRALTGRPDFSYEISCAQLCGLGHYRMRGFLTVHTDQGFQSWLEEQAAQLVPRDEEDEFWD